MSLKINSAELAPFEKLIQDVWSKIDSFLSVQENRCLARVSKAMHRIMNSEGFWRARIVRDFCVHMLESPDLKNNNSDFKHLYKELYIPSKKDRPVIYKLHKLVESMLEQGLDPFGNI